MNKITKICLYTVTSPLWIVGVTFVTLGLLHIGVISFSDIFSRKDKKERKEKEK